MHSKITVFLVVCLASFTHAQSTVCVADPLIPGTRLEARQGVRSQIERWLTEMKKDIILTDCQHAKWELVAEQLNWSYTGDPSVVVAPTGVAVFDGSTASGTSWEVAVFPQGQVYSIYHGLGVGLKGNVKKAIKAIRKQEKKREN